MNDADDSVLKGIHKNPFLLMNVIYNYAAFTEIVRVYTQYVKLYFEYINASTTESNSVKMIAKKHYLFGALFYYEQHVDCSDPRTMDCIFLKGIIETYKTTGVYEQYVKYISQYQIQNTLTSASQKGGVRGYSIMYVIMFLLMSLLEIEMITVDRASAFGERINSDLTVYYENIAKNAPELLNKQYLIKLMSLNGGSLGVSSFQSLMFNNPPDVVRNIYLNKIRPEYNAIMASYIALGAVTKRFTKYNVGSDLIYERGAKTPFVLHTTSYTSIQQMRKHAQDVYTHLIQIYEMPPTTRDLEMHTPDTAYERYYANYATSYLQSLIPDTILSAIYDKDSANRAKYEEYAAEINNKMHISDLTQASEINIREEPLIITFVASIDDQAFNLLYNTKNGKFCIFDIAFLEKLQKMSYDAENRYSVTNQYLKYEDDEDIDTWWDILKAKGRQMTGRSHALPPIRIFISEPGFWEGSAFENNDNFKNLNKYQRDIFTYYYIKRKMPIREGGITVNIENMFINEPGGDVIVNNVHGWGCATLDNCGESAIETLEAFNALLKLSKTYLFINKAIDIGTGVYAKSYEPAYKIAVQSMYDDTNKAYPPILLPAIKYERALDTARNIVGYNIELAKSREAKAKLNTASVKKGGRRRHRLRIHKSRRHRFRRRRRYTRKY